jgi:hypothetical protein
MRVHGEGERLGEDRGGLVRGGDLHTYKIHLGSINILTHPDDSYLERVRQETRPDQEADPPVHDDLVQRDSTAAGTHRLWLADIIDISQ